MSGPQLVSIFLLASFCQACATNTATVDSAGLHAQIVATEKAFAKTMHDRDFDAFRSYLADDTIFFSGAQPLRGKDAVADVWQRYFEAVEAPFSWGPTQVAVSNSGELALSSGPVYSPEGTEIGTFTSIWRRAATGEWQIIFDKGGCFCD